MERADVIDAHDNLSRAGLLRTAPDGLVDAFRRVKSPLDVGNIEYFIIPSQAAREVGKLVLPYVTLDPQGFLVADVPHAYAVTNSPDMNAIKSPAARERVQALHAIAEEHALRNGIFTPHGRTIAEIATVRCTARAYQPTFMSDRRAHLLALEAEADASSSLSNKQRSAVIQNLRAAAEALQEPL